LRRRNSDAHSAASDLSSLLVPDHASSLVEVDFSTLIDVDGSFPHTLGVASDQGAKRKKFNAPCENRTHASPSQGAATARTPRSFWRAASAPAECTRRQCWNVLTTALKGLERCLYLEFDQIYSSPPQLLSTLLAHACSL